MMEKGSSQPWQSVLKELTDGRTDKLDASAMMDYFKPLYDWLLEQNVTQSEWNCDKYVDRKRNVMRSYSTFSKVNRNHKHADELSSDAVSKFNSNQIFFVFIIFYLICY